MSQSRTQPPHRVTRRLARLLALVVGGAVFWLASTPAPADPAPWAPAHGWRAKHHGDDRHGHRHDRRLPARRQFAQGLPAYGRCGLVAGLVGAAAGGALGAQLGGGDGKPATTAAGTLLGYLVGGSVGRAMDVADRDCLGRTLDRVPDAQTVTWSNPGADAFYRVTPYESYHSAGRYCREYTVRAAVRGRQQQAFGTACRRADGSWQMVD